MRVLITYFEPFGADTVNASAQAAALLPDEIAGAEVVKVQLPVVFSDAETALLAALEAVSPDVVLCTGQAEGIAELHLERVAVNLRDAARADNSGTIPDEAPIVPDGPAAYFAALPVKRLAKQLREQGIPTAVSNSAGTYVCNDVMYTLLHWCAGQSGSILGGFVHVPLTPEQAAVRSGAVPSMDAAAAARGLQTVIRALQRLPRRA